MKKSKELMDNITYKIRNRDEISEQLIYIKVLTSEAKRIRKFINKEEKDGKHGLGHLKTTAGVLEERVEVLKQKLYNVDLGDLL
jgi:hypothetical protein|tara:strand:+ start:933 stop:1184 length:252 start_codon:yes stop_codon:yes gene_type:complete